MCDEITVSVKYGKVQFSVQLQESDRVCDLLSELERVSGLMARKQKLMAKGKVVSQSPQATLAAAGITSGAKLMLLAAAGGAAGSGASSAAPPPSAGAAALAALQQKRAEALTAKRAALGSMGPAGAAAAAAGAATQQQPGSMQQRAAAWAKTGIASVRDLGLAELPPELFEVAGSIRVLDAGGCRLTALPPSLSALSGLQRLRLSGSSLSESSIDWAALAALTSLSVLALDGNRLTALPPEACALTSLQSLSLGGNRLLTSLPPDVSRLSSLRFLSLRGCRLSTLPPELGACAGLEELDVRSNQLLALPPELARPPALRAILADDNRIGAVPEALLRDAPALCTLGLHDNPITADALREAPGFAEFDARRRTKYNKKIGMALATTFDEGADSELSEMWEHLK